MAVSKRSGPNCDREMVATFDYSKLDAAFDKLSKPAKRALINNRIYAARDLAKWARGDVASLHGIGPSAFPVLEAALKSAKTKFKA